MQRGMLFAVTLLGAALTAACGDNFDRDLLLGNNVTPEEMATDEECHDVALPDEADIAETPDDAQGDEAVMPDAAVSDSGVPDGDSVSSPQCGNGIVESGETCDGGSMSCAILLGSTYTGNAGCRADCAGWNTSSCWQEVTHAVYAVDPAKCTGCRRCLPACAVKAISMVSYKAVIDPEKCTGCGTCVSWCPRGAIYKKP